MKYIDSGLQFLFEKNVFVKFSVILLVITGITVYILSHNDRLETIAAEEKQDAVLLAGYHKYVSQDTQRNSLRLYSSIRALREVKNNNLDDATFYYFGLFFYSPVLGICSILGGILIILLISKTQPEKDADIRNALGFLFFVCSVAYLIPRIMNNEKNYEANLSEFYACKKQMIYNARVLSYYYCCDTSSMREHKLTALADSNFTILQTNMGMHYEINVSEAAKSFEELQNSYKGMNKGQ